MQESMIFEGKTSTEAIENGLSKLHCRKEDVEIKILENEEKRSFYSILAPRVVKVEITLKNNKISREIKNNEKADLEQPLEEDFETAIKSIKDFLDKFVKEFGSLTYDIKKVDNMIVLSIDGSDASKLIGYRGEIINSLQILISAIANKKTKNRVKVLLDICQYKQKREETLKELAKKLEKTVLKTGKKVVLEPMTAYERKIIHTELQNSDKVTTYSIGEEPRRKVVIDKK